MKKTQLLFKRAMILSFTFLLLTISTLTVKAAGEVDPTFNTAIQTETGATVLAVAIQPDGKVIAAGNFTVANNSGRTGIARFNTDGSVDQSFYPPDFVGISSGYQIKAVSIKTIALQTDGKVLVGGSFDRVNNLNRKYLVRLNADGSLDSTFAPILGARETINDIKVQANGQIVYSGSIDVSGGGQGLTRLNPNGSVDPSLQFNRQNRAVSFLIQPDGKFIINASSGVGIYRLNSDGSIDNSFFSVSVTNVFTLALQSDGKLLIGGNFSIVNGIQSRFIARLNLDGNLDTTFNASGSGPNAPVRAIGVLTDGKIVIGGEFNIFNGTSRARNARLNGDGTLDLSFNFNPDINAVVYAVAPTSNGGVILGGTDTNGIWNKLSRLNPNGSLDTGFVAAIYNVGVIKQVLTQPDGKVLVAGTFRRVNGISTPGLVRLNTNGSLDTGFTAGVTGANSIALLSDGKILVGGGNILRLNSDGSIDSSFQSPGFPFAFTNRIAVLPDGKIIIAGAFRISNLNVAVARLNSNGSEDTTFNRVILTDGTLSFMVLAMKIQPDGKIIVGGTFNQLNGVTRGRLARLNTDGTLDTSFNLLFGVGGNVGGGVFDLGLQSDNSIILGGGFSSVNGTANYYYLARLLPNVSLDMSFNQTPNAQIYAIAVQPDDKILFGGVFDTVAGVPHGKIARFNSSGTIDTAFNTNANDTVFSIQPQSDGKILVGGDFNRINGVSSVGVARLLNAATPTRTQFDFDGDGKSDVSVFRPSTGYWYTSTNPALNYGAIQFGIATDKLVPADYDGDGKTDVAVFRDGNWYIQRSRDGFVGIAFGLGTDLPIPADYDGDGVTDVAVFRPSNGTWYLLKSLEGYAAVPFGEANDKPVPADYDGDGKANVAVFRPSNGYWYTSINPAINYGAVLFGTAEDKPVPADYDGDGKADVAVFRPSNGTWYLNRSRDGFAGIAFGLGTDLPVAADYDGDGKADIAVFRNGTWYLNRTTQGFSAVAFGLSDDKPVPNAFVR